MKKLLLLIKEYPDTIITIIVGILMTIWGIIGTEVNYLLAAITLILTALAFSMLRDRQARDGLVKEIQNLEQSLLVLSSGKITADVFFSSREKYGHFAERFKDSQTLDMIGASLLSVTTTNQSVLRNLKSSGAKIRLLISNPENSSLQKFLGLRHLEAESSNAHSTFVRTSISSVVPMVGDLPNGGSIQIRLTNQIPGYSYIGEDTNKPTGKIFVEFYLTKIALDKNPIANIDASSDPRWFEEFRNQFEYLWNHSTELDTSKYK